MKRSILLLTLWASVFSFIVTDFATAQSDPSETIVASSPVNENGISDFLVVQKFGEQLGFTLVSSDGTRTPIPLPDIESDAFVQVDGVTISGKVLIHADSFIDATHMLNYSFYLFDGIATTTLIRSNSSTNYLSEYGRITDTRILIVSNKVLRNRDVSATSSLTLLDTTGKKLASKSLPRINQVAGGPVGNNNGEFFATYSKTASTSTNIKGILVAKDKIKLKVAVPSVIKDGQYSPIEMNAQRVVTAASFGDFIPGVLAKFIAGKRKLLLN